MASKKQTLGKHFAPVVVKHGKRLPIEPGEYPFRKIFKLPPEKTEIFSIVPGTWKIKTVTNILIFVKLPVMLSVPPTKLDKNIPIRELCCKNGTVW